VEEGRFKTSIGYSADPTKAVKYTYFQDAGSDNTILITKDDPWLIPHAEIYFFFEQLDKYGSFDLKLTQTKVVRPLADGAWLKD